jgi:hypothetical protein
MPRIPITVKIIPPMNKIATIILGHPKTVNSYLNAPIMIQRKVKIENNDVSNPKSIARWRGL